jgi:hypothetical protein
MNINSRLSTLCALGLSALAVGCDGGTAQDGSGTSVNLQHGGAMPNLNLPGYQYRPSGTGINNNAGSAGTTDLSVDYNLALRSATIKLRGDLPTLTEMRQMQAAVKANLSNKSAGDPQFVYEAFIDALIADTKRFNNQMVVFWRNQLRMGGSINGLLGDSATAIRPVSLETAPTLLGRLTATGADMRTAFTQTTNNCPKFDPTTGAFADGNCNTGLAVTAAATGPEMGNNVAEGSQAGILTNPGFLAQYYSNLGFRRQRIIEEVFTCNRFPAEISPTPQIINSALYSAPWPLKTITSNAAPPTYTTRRIIGGATVTNQDYVDFNIEQGCYNCHTTMNHRAPLFTAFDAVGFRDAMDRSMVHSPVTNLPFTEIQDFLPASEANNKAWRYQVPASNIQQFGQAMAADPQIAKCFMIRLWNEAYSRDDVVNDQALVPDSVIAPMTKYFVDNNYNMKLAIKKLYTDANFIRF